MKKLLFLTLTVLLSSTCLFAQTKAGKTDTTQHASYYTCPMHPDVAEMQAGKCPKCGMELNLTPKEQMNSNLLKTFTCPVHLSVVSHDPGKCPKCGKKLHLSPKEQMKAETAKIYTCPMHPEVALNKEGECPKCGKALVKKN